MRMRAATPVPADTPISDLNTTPLIDVLLVLLIMFIITIPVTTHKVPLDLPQGTTVERDPVVHRLGIDAAGSLSLDGAPLAASDLRARLAAVAADPGGELHLIADPETPYQRFDEVLAAVRVAGVTRLGMDNARYASGGF